jgi:hypothetical protein
MQHGFNPISSTLSVVKKGNRIETSHDHAVLVYENVLFVEGRTLFGFQVTLSPNSECKKILVILQLY